MELKPLFTAVFLSKTLSGRERLQIINKMENINTCLVCGKTKPISEFISERRLWCKDCKQKYMENYRKSEEYQERHKTYMKEYRRLHRRKTTVRVRTNVLSRDDYRHEYYLKNKDKLYAQSREAIKRYYKTEKGKAYKARKHHERRAKINGLLCDLTAGQWEEIRVSQNYRCNICGEEKPLHRDHIIPVSKGGHFTKSNIQGLCRNCNSRKSNKIIINEL